MEQILHSLAELKPFLKKQKPSSICLITSKTLAKKLSWALQEIGVDKSNIILIPDGEAAKEWKELEKVLAAFRSKKVNRRSIVIALGGGAVGDLAGFAASIYLRGIRYVQVPTTLLAQVDSAHGGKTGINFRGAKNQIGATYLPLATVVDARFLKSLAPEQVVDGLGEILKAGLIKDPSILALLKKETVATLPKSRRLKEIIDRSIAVKRFFVKKDPRELGARKILNFGHTVGHAIELKHGISHGRAVIIGMLEELRTTESLKLTDSSVRKNLLQLLTHLGIKAGPSFKTDSKLLGADKKLVGKFLELPVVVREGQCTIMKIDLHSFIQATRYHG